MPERRRATEVAKVMDITHPSNVQPSTTSRPVLVTNRPMIAEDPMIAQAAQSAIDIEKPAGAPTEDTPPDVLSAPEVTRQGKTVTPVSVKVGEAEPAKPEEPSVPPNQPQPQPVTITIDAGPEDAVEEQIAVAEPSEAQPEPSAEEELPKESVKPKEAETKPKTEPTPSFNLQTPKTIEKTTFAAMNDDSQLDEGDAETKEKTAEDKRQEELEAIVTAGTYHVPIGQVAKRRGRVLFLVVLIVVLLVVLFDLALDTGLFTVSGVPHTNFLR